MECAGFGDAECGRQRHKCARWVVVSMESGWGRRDRTALYTPPRRSPTRNAARTKKALGAEVKNTPRTPATSRSRHAIAHRLPSPAVLTGAVVSSRVRGQQEPGSLRAAPLSLRMRRAHECRRQKTNRLRFAADCSRPGGVEGFNRFGALEHIWTGVKP